MNIISQGLRRSGTTILFDILSEDKRFSSFYEPLCLGRKTIGGGSGMKEKDLTELLRSARTEYSKNNRVKGNVFNIGAPTDYRLEVFKNKLPKESKKYLNFLLNYNNNCILKFTRATFIIEDLHKLDPNAVFLHVQKNPALWAMSHIFKKNYGHKMSKDPELFFNRKSGFNRWSQEYIVDFYLKKKGKNNYLNKPAFFKLLFLWKTFNDIIESNGKKFYKEKYLKINNEDLYFKYDKIIKEIYLQANMSVSESSLSWAKDNLKNPKQIVFLEDKRWYHTFDELGIDKKYLCKF